MLITILINTFDNQLANDKEYENVDWEALKILLVDEFSLEVEVSQVYVSTSS